MTISKYLTYPSFYHPDRVREVYRVPYQQRALEAKLWQEQHQINPAFQDRRKIGLLLIDVQNTFCLPEFELFVAGTSGNGAVEDNVRLCEFIYRHLGAITEILPTMDTHTAVQIFHSIFWVNEAQQHPEPGTTITLAEVEEGKWQINPQLQSGLSQNIEQLRQHALHYVQKLSDEDKYPLTIWPYHSMVGGIGHALVSAVEEAIFFHSLARQSPTKFELKGSNPLTENYSVLSPEVLDTADGKAIARQNTSLVQKLLAFDVLIIAGQAKSHCVAWTIENLLTEIQAVDPNLAQKIYLLEDCMSPVVIPGVIDFSEQAEETFEKFAAAGMKIVKSTELFNHN
ncbi:MAG: isochorismatase [Cyanobacteria bacterium J06600_6]